MARSQDEIFNCVGTAGGVILAFALIPQIFLAHKRKTCKDISYMWQCIYITGLVTLMVYYAHFGLWPVFCPVAFECSCLVYLTLLKVYYERVNGAAGSRQQQSSPLMESSSTNGVKPVGGARRSPSMGKYGAAGYAAAPDAAPKV